MGIKAKTATLSTVPLPSCANRRTGVQPLGPLLPASRRQGPRVPSSGLLRGLALPCRTIATCILPRFTTPVLAPPKCRASERPTLYFRSLTRPSHPSHSSISVPRIHMYRNCGAGRLGWETGLGHELDSFNSGTRTSNICWLSAERTRRK